MMTNDNPVLVSSWEFVTTLDYEWSVIRRHRTFRWTIFVSVFLLNFCCPGPGAGLIYSVWQIYSTTRISTLIAVILYLVRSDVTVARFNCEARMFHVCFICNCDLIDHDPKVESVFLLVSKPFPIRNLVYVFSMETNLALAFLGL